MTGMITQPYRRPSGGQPDNYLVTLAQEFDLAGLVHRKGLEPRIDLRDFLLAHPSGKARIWAVGISAPANRAWEKMQLGDLILFYGANEVYAFGTLASKTLWDGNDSIWPSGTNWDHIYSVSNFTELPEGQRLKYQALRQITPKLDVQSVGYRDLNEVGVSVEKVIDFVKRTGPRSEKVSTSRKSSSDLFGLTRVEIEEAIEVYDELGKDVFLSRFGLNAAQKYRIQLDSGPPRDAKALIDYALRQRKDSQLSLAPNEWDGNKKTVAEPLRRLGFKVVEGWQAVADMKQTESFLNEFGLKADRELLGEDPAALAEAIRGLDGPLEQPVTSWRRTEQNALRRVLLKGKSKGICLFCCRQMDAELLVAAHIKRRSKCTDSEKRDVSNVVMLNCRFGCDELYGRGYIAVSDLKHTLTSKVLDDEVALEYIEERIQPDVEVKAGQTQYFEWHRTFDFRNTK